MFTIIPSSDKRRRLVYEVLHSWARMAGLSTFNIGFAPIDPSISGDHRFVREAHQIQLYLALAEFGGLLGRANDLKNIDVLEVAMGCGGGLALLTERICNAQVMGIDNAVSAVRAARRRGLAVRQGSAEQLPFDCATFDVLLCVDSFSIFNRKAFLKEASRVLRPSGQILIGDYLTLSVDGVRQQLATDIAGLDLEVRRFEDVTAGVLLALEADQDRKARIVRRLPKVVRSQLAETLSLRGSDRYGAWCRGEVCYYFAALGRAGLMGQP